MKEKFQKIILEFLDDIDEMSPREMFYVDRIKTRLSFLREYVENLSVVKPVAPVSSLGGSRWEFRDPRC